MKEIVHKVQVGVKFKLAGMYEAYPFYQSFKGAEWDSARYTTLSFIYNYFQIDETSSNTK